MLYCFAHDIFLVFYRGRYVCPKHEIAAGNGTTNHTHTRWIPARKD